MKDYNFKFRVMPMHMVIGLHVHERALIYSLCTLDANLMPVRHRLFLHSKET